MQIVRKTRRFLSGIGERSNDPFAELQSNWAQAQSIVRFFYLISVYYVSNMLPKLHSVSAPRPNMDFVWLLTWAEGLDILVLVQILALIALGFALAAFFLPNRLLFRAGFSIFFLLCIAVFPSLGAVNHADHAWFWVSFAFIFLPSSTTRIGKLNYCLTFAATQALFMLFYSLAGLWKTLYGFIALASGEEGNFSPRGLALTLADRMTQTGTEPLLGPFLVENYFLSWPMFLFIIYAQLVAVIVVFRPRLHALWGLIIIGFHTGTFLLMEIAFPNHILLLMLLMVASPFQKRDWFQISTVWHFPGLSFIGSKLGWTRETESARSS